MVGSRTRKTKTTLKVAVGTVKKSIETISWAAGDSMGRANADEPRTALGRAAATGYTWN